MNCSCFPSCFDRVNDRTVVNLRLWQFLTGMYRVERRVVDRKVERVVMVDGVATRSVRFC